MIIDHDHPQYRAKWRRCGGNRWNGAFYYSKEIVENIIPLIVTDRNWMTVNVPNVGAEHSIVFIHNNLHPEYYDWLKRYDDLILVCGIGDTAKNMGHLGKAIYLPLSVDVEYVKQFRREKTKDTAFVGRQPKRRGVAFPKGTDIIEGMRREQLLERMAEYEKVYAVGRTAIEAKILGCKVLPYDERFPDPRRWRIVDNKDAAAILQEKLNKIDGGR